MANNPDQYTYYIHTGPEEMIAEITVPEPLPHIAVGNQLIINTDNYDRLGGHVITHVRVATSFLRDAFTRYEIYVWGEHRGGLPPDRA